MTHDMRYIIIFFVDILRLSWDSRVRTYYSGHDSMLCVILALEMILNILYISFFYHIYVSMYLFYVVDGLDIKKIEKK